MRNVAERGHYPAKFNLAFRRDVLRSMLAVRGRQHQIAVAMGIHPTRVKDWTTDGRPAPKSDHLLELSSLLGLSAAAFYKVEDMPDGRTARLQIAELVKNSLGDYEAEVIEAMGPLTAENKRAVVAMARAIQQDRPELPGDRDLSEDRPVSSPLVSPPSRKSSEKTGAGRRR